MNVSLVEGTVHCPIMCRTAPTAKHYPTQMSVVPQLRNPGVKVGIIGRNKNVEISEKKFPVRRNSINPR